MQRTVYIDESGTPGKNSDKDGLDKRYVLVAILTNSEEELELRKGLEKISDDYFSKSPIKSSNVGPNNERRITILKEIVKLNFVFVALVVDKTKIERETGGLRFKGVSYKFFQRRLYQNITSLENIKLCLDKHGSKEFMDSFDNYISGFSQMTLSGGIDGPYYKDSKECRLIQLADFIAGSLRTVYLAEERTLEISEILELLIKKESGIQAWPPKYYSIDLGITEENFVEDKALSESIIKKSEDLIQQNRESKMEEEVIQAMTLQWLLINYRKTEDSGYLTSDKLIEMLRNSGFEIGKQAFTSKIIGGIRDRGILISGTSKGYKLALTYQDVKDYYQHSQTVIIPMLNRVNIAKNTTNQISPNDDLLDKFPELNNILTSHIKDNLIK